jgi:hypothetical protein
MVPDVSNQRRPVVVFLRQRQKLESLSCPDYLSYIAASGKNSTSK